MKKNIMRIAKLISSILVFMFILSSTLFANEKIMQAMRDEIKRSLDELHLESLQKPYYIEYVLKITGTQRIISSLGYIDESEAPLKATLTTTVKVGNYKYDNTNFFDVGLSFFGSSDDEEVFKNRNIPLELDYTTLRRELWLATDAAYKQAAEIYSKKDAIIKNRMRKDTTHDFIYISPQKLNDTIPFPRIDTKNMEQLLKKLSGVFINYPEIQTSTVGFEYIPTTSYFVNSEGREYIKNESYIGLEIAAVTQAEDGMPLVNFFSAHGLHPADLPVEDSLMRASKLVAEKLITLRNAPSLEEAYSGPLLFEGQAAAQIFAQIFAPNLVAQRSQLTEYGSQDNESYASFQTKIGGRVLPENLSVEAVPSKPKWDATPLAGHFIIDNDGVQPQDVLLVENGYLKTLLSSRIPTRRIRQSNGHNRGGAAMYSSIYLYTDKASAKTEKDQIQQMLKLCKDRELEFGLIVRKVIDQNIYSTTLMRITDGLLSPVRTNIKIPLVEVYKVYTDGREELIRGCEAKGFTVQSFKDILNTGNKSYTMNYLAPAVTSPFISGGDQYLGASVIVPDLLFEDGEIKPVEDDFPKPPILHSPLTIKGSK